MEKAKLMEMEIEEKRKLPYSVKQGIKKRIFWDLVVAAIIMLYFCIVNVIFYKFDSNKFEEYLKYFALIIIIATVTTFEIAYRKNSVNSMIIGIELLLCGILTLYIPYIFLHTDSALRISVMILPVMLIGYYSAKSFAIYKKRQIEYHKNLSDVKEIVTNKPESYLEEDSKKSFREKLRREKLLKQKISEEQKLKKKQKDSEIKK